MKSRYVHKEPEEPAPPPTLPATAIELAELCEKLWLQYHRGKSNKLKEQYNTAAELYNQRYFKSMKIL